jgi:hypothetical protein
MEAKPRKEKVQRGSAPLYKQYLDGEIEEGRECLNSLE